VYILLAKPGAKPSAAKLSAAKKKDKIPKVTMLSQVTGGRGTLKRRRQLQQLIDHHQQMFCSNDADLFSSTPYRSTRLPTVSLFRFI